MKLDKNTRKSLRIGDILKFSDSEKYIVITILENRFGGLTATIQDVFTKRTIYLIAVSKLYGSEIIREEN